MAKPKTIVAADCTAAFMANMTAPQRARLTRYHTSRPVVLVIRKKKSKGGNA